MAANTLQVNMLGGFSLSYGDGSRPLTDRDTRSRKVLSIIQYLITFRTREIPRHEIIDLLWSDDDSTDPVNALKTLLHRVRSAISETGFDGGKDIIISHAGAYAWNNSYPITVDVEEFDKLLSFDSNIDEKEKLERTLQAISIYKGDFLSNSPREAWIGPISTYYHSQYLSAVHYAVEQLSFLARFDDIIEICRAAVAIDPYDEPVHLAMIRALIASGMQQQAMQHYNYVTDLFMKGFGITPSAELTALYREIVKTTKSIQTNLTVIREDLRERDDANGAFFCEYEFFKSVYHLEARAARRSGEVVHIALITVMDTFGKAITQKQMNTTMDRLKDVIGKSLRAGDAFCRYSVSQFLIMLPTASFENSEKVLQRISRNFKKEYPHMQVMLNYSALPLQPK